MITGNIYNEKCTAYPGEYSLLPETEMLVKKLDTLSAKGTRLSVIPAEHPDFYQLEITLPWQARREDIFIYVHRHSFTLIVLRRKEEPAETGEAGHACVAAPVSQAIDIPAWADPELATAEYHGHVLRIFVPRNGAGNAMRGVQQIIVY